MYLHNFMPSINVATSQDSKYQAEIKNVEKEKIMITLDIT